MAAQSFTPDDRLDSWKEIAAYLKRGVRTVQRWEQTASLPIHRLEHDRQGSVFAYRAELDAWWETRRRQPETKVTDELPPAQPVEISAPKGTSSRKLVFASLGLAVMAASVYLGSRHAPAGTVVRSLNAIPLTSDLGSEAWPAFSPDGNRVAYAWDGPSQNNFDIYIKTIGADASVRLTSSPESDAVPAWSPDGSQIGFLRYPPHGNPRLMLIPAAGGSERAITELHQGTSSLSWSPDGKWIVSSEGRQPPLLVAIAVETGQRRPLTSPQNNYGDWFPAVAPDGSSVVFARDSGATSDLYRLRMSPGFAAVGTPERLTTSNSWTGMPAFTADGRAIVYSSGLYEENLGLWLLPLEPGAQPTSLLVRPGDQLFSPVISRANNRLAFSAEKGESRSGTWKLDLTSNFRPAGSSVRLISSTHTDYNAKYSPDGRRIVFHSTRSGGSEIWSSDANGQHVSRLTRLNAPITGSPNWSPDGQWIVFDSNAGGQFEVYRMRVEGGTPEQLTRSPGVDGVPSWSRDGRSIYFVSDRSGSYQVWRMSADGSNPRQITRNGGYLAIESFDGKWLYYCKLPGVSPLLRVPVDGGKEEEVLPAVHEFNFCLTRKGVLFSRSARLLEFLSFETGQIAPFARLDRPLKIGLALSPDQRHLLFSQGEAESDRGADLMLVENFKPSW